jgi:hypothetical protein
MRSSIHLALLALTSLPLACFSSGESLPSDELPSGPGGSMPPPIALGAWHEGFELGDGLALQRYTQEIGSAPAVVHWYQDWVQSPMFVPGALSAAYASGAIPMITWKPHDDGKDTVTDQPDFSLGAIAAGKHDTYIHAFAKASHDFGRPYLLRFAHEMNGNWYSWSPGVNGNMPSDFIAAWTHVVGIFRDDGATNVQFVWCPNVSFDGTRPLTETYPGDALVDWIGLDGYNWGTDQGMSWTGFDDLFESSYATLIALTEKPFLIAEVSSAEEGGDKAAWIRDAFFESIPQRYPRVRAVLWYDQDLTALRMADWRVDSSPDALAAFQAVAASDRYRGSLR